nr:MAG TPA: RimK-related lysine biosynthesis protein, Probable-dependent amine/thiol ligase family Amino-group [Caudoviricetes sp.]
MFEYIKREAALMKLMQDGCNAKNLQSISDIPAADVAPVVYGRWIHSRYEDCSEQFELVKCSQCNHEAYAMALYVHGGNYCPNCGAKMDGGDNTER